MCITTSEKLTKLRSLMQQNNIDALLVPNTDEYQGEYIPPYAQRLKWLTNFSGSSGFAVILQEEAHLFTDGRYQIQIRDQTDNHLFNYHNSIEEPLSSWIKKRARPIQMGYDAWLHSPQEVSQLENALNIVQGQLKALSYNLIDQLWQNQPSAPITPLFIQEIKFCGQNYQEKLQIIKEKLIQQKVDAFIFTDPTSLAWLFNIRGSDIPHIPISLCRAIIFAKNSSALHDTIFINSQKLNKETKQYLEQNLVIHEENDFLSYLETNLKQGPQKLIFGLDLQKAPQKLYQLFTENKIKPKAIFDPVLKPRAIKNSCEIKNAKIAQKSDTIALIRFFAWLDQQKIGTISEMDCVDKLLYFRQTTGKEQGNIFKEPSFDTIAGSGPNGAIIHYGVNDKTNRILQEGDLFLLDSGGQYQGGTTDITRTIAIGTPSWTQKYYYTLVLKAMLALTLAKFPENTSGSALDSIARHILWQANADYAHGTGHGVGAYLSVHEGPPGISPLNKEPLKQGMILSNEPGYYQKDAFGIRLENLLLTVKSVEKQNFIEGTHKDMLAFETLTFCPFDQKLILREHLDQKTLQFLNSYHEKIYLDNSEQLNNSEKNWLYKATRPLI